MLCAGSFRFCFFSAFSFFWFAAAQLFVTDPHLASSMTNLFALCALFLAGCGAAAAGTAAPSKSIFDELWKNSTAQNLIKAGDLSLFELLLRSHLEKNFDGTVKELAESGLGQFPNVMPLSLF